MSLSHGQWPPAFRIGFGAMRLCGEKAWGPPKDLSAARLILRRAIELGAELIDTADIYGPAISEELIADSLYPYPSHLIIATKGGLEKTAPGVVRHRASPQALRAACEASLRRLRLEQIPLYQLHAVDPAVPIEDSIGALVDLQKEGKIRHIGLCNVTAAEIETVLEITKVASIQNRFSILEQEAADTLDICEREGALFLPWFPLAGGALARAGEVFKDIAKRHGATPSQLSIAWLLHRSPSIVPIPGTQNMAHLEENVRALSLRLTAEELTTLVQSLHNP